MPENHPRISREENTISAMISIYCRDKHGLGDQLCPACEELRDYALSRLQKCPFQEAKTTCANCRVHCYKPAMRDKVKEVMRHSGPKMAYKHPILAFYHFFDGRKLPRKLQ
ncbi:MAG: nitrous oxide-stimulated promoter family protein [Nitrospirae bacterium]|nr:nitrous oxide-stimulated promoter family protein [Nitrospirota bacterium]